MDKSYLEEFKNKYSFFEDYGFILANDPCNPNRLCYKNIFGEIVIWTKDETGILSPYQLYVQINGWKTEINVKEQYKKYINKVTLFKPFEKLVKELFEYYVRRYKEFYGLKVLKNNFNPYPKLDEKTINYNHSFNPIKEGRKASNISKVIIIFAILILAQIIPLIFIDLFTTYKSIYIYKTIVYSSILFLGLLTSIVCREYLNLLSKLYIIIYPISLLILLNYYPRRIDYIVYLAFFVFSLIYFSYYLIRFKVMNKPGMANGLITAIYPCLIYCIKTIELSGDLYFTNLKAKCFLIISVILTLIAVITYVVLKEDKSDKKEFVGGMFATIICVFALTFACPYLTAKTLNYTFDESIGVEHEFRILDKEIRRSSGRRSTNIYKLTIIVDGKEEKITVSSYVYYSYDLNETIELSYHEGFFGCSYYEYIESE